MALPKLQIRTYIKYVPNGRRKNGMVPVWVTEVQCDEPMTTCNYGYSSPDKDYDEFDIGIFAITRSIPNYRGGYFYTNTLCFHSTSEPDLLTRARAWLATQRYIVKRRKLIARQTVTTVAS